MTQKEDPHAASAERRKRLKELETQSSTNQALANILDTFPIEKYYGMAERLLMGFLHAMDTRRLDDAYILGLRFATFSLEGLPNHAQYNSPLTRAQRSKNARNLESVLEKLENVATRMDAEERIKELQRKEQLQHQQEAAKTKKEKKNSKSKPSSEHEKEKRYAESLRKQREAYEAEQKVLRAQRAKQDAHDARRRMEQSARDKLKFLQQKTESRQESNKESTKTTLHRQEPPDKKEDANISQESEPTSTSGLLSKLNLFQSSNKVSKPTAEQIQSPEPSTSTSTTSLLSLERPESKATLTHVVPASTGSKPTSTDTKVRKKDASGNVEQKKSAKSVGNGTPSKASGKGHPKEETTGKPVQNSIGQTTAPKQSVISTKCSAPGFQTSRDHSKHKSSSPYKPKLTPAETRTMARLQRTIQVQEERLTFLEENDERPHLKKEAKARLDQGDRKGALHCLAKRRRLNKNIDVAKNAIFNMETQMLMLESASENREVSKIMKEASDAMSDLEKQAGGVHTTDVISDDDVNEILSCAGVDVDEEELLSELMFDSTDALTSDDQSILTLPSAPYNEFPESEDPEVSVSDSKGFFASLLS